MKGTRPLSTNEIIAVSNQFDGVFEVRNRSLYESYWKDQFYILSSDVEMLVSYLRTAKSPVPIVELAEMLVRNFFERIANTRIYSPEQTYQVGEGILFLFQKNESGKYGKVLEITKGHQARLDPSSKRITFDRITVRFETSGELRKFVSNCPGFPTRFQWSRQNNVPYTPGQIVNKFADVILPQIEKTLKQDKRVVNFKTGWLLKVYLNLIEPAKLNYIYEQLKFEKKPLPTEMLLKEMVGITNVEAEYPLWQFSLNWHLATDSQKRFINTGSEEQELWAIKVPPKTVIVTLTTDAFENGCIKVTQGLGEMIEFYELGSEITFTVFGNYKVKGQLDWNSKLICGEEIKDWYVENALTTGNQIYIHAPAAPNTFPKLYTLYDKEPSHTSDGKDVERAKELLLRHRIYHLLKEANQFLHYREIGQRISAIAGQEIRIESVEATLSLNNHLFVRRGSVRGIWGLVEWGEIKTTQNVDQTSLLIAITEEDLVYEALKNHGEPMDVREIAEIIAEMFVVKTEEVLETTFIDPNDQRLVKLSDGTWWLSEWLKEWEQQLDVVETRLNELSQRKSELAEIEKQLEAEKEKLSYLKSEEIKVLEEHSEMVQSLTQRNDELNRVDDRQQQMAAQITVLKGQQRQYNHRVQRKRNQRKVVAATTVTTSIALWFFLEGLLAYFIVLAFLLIGTVIFIHSFYKGQAFSKQLTLIFREQKEVQRTISQLQRQKQHLEIEVSRISAEAKNYKGILEKLRAEIAAVELVIESAEEPIRNRKIRLEEYDEAKLLADRQHLQMLISKIRQPA